MGLDSDIKDAFGLAGVLLVFVFTYFSLVLSRAEELLGTPTPTVAADRRRLQNRCADLRRMLIGLEVVVVAVVALLAPLTVRTVRRLEWAPFNTVRAGLLLVQIFLVGLGFVGGRFIQRASRRIAEIAAQDAKQ